MNSYDDVSHGRETLEYAVDTFLRKKGWTHTCSTPGSLWLWEKEVEWHTHELVRRSVAHAPTGDRKFRKVRHKRLVMTDKETALRIQRALDDK